MSAGTARRRPALAGPGALRPGFRLERGMRVGLFGGSFDPPHEGHLHVAETALLRLGLHRVIWLVSPQNPLKTGSAPLPQRLDATRRLAARGVGGPAMIVSDVEARIGARFTVDTVRVFQARHPGVRFVWIMGGDNLAGFHRWRAWADLFRALPVAVIARPNALLAGRFSPAARRFGHARIPAGAARRLPELPAPAWAYLPVPLNPMSSTALRDRTVTVAGARDRVPVTGR